ncbi:MAG: hypothetical protein GY925_04470 [Actinomycetia bacterium]|nr:hypothetical protein [Actinomycetes bacterium]
MSTSVPVWPCSIAVDVGGTFTDIVMVDAEGRLEVAKTPSVPNDPSRGAIDALRQLATELGIDPEVLLGNCTRFVHGTTVATNAVLERKTARVGLITTAGFRDALEIRRGIRDNQWDHRAPWPPVLVPRHLRVGVRGRIARSGNELESLDENAVGEALDHFEHEGVEAVAICLLHSYTNPAHEIAIAEMARQRWEGALTSASHELVPLIGEYERTSTTVVNAGLVPSVGGYLRRLAAELHRLGLRSPLLLIQSNGGTVPVGAAAARPVDLVLSGPAAVGGALDRASGGIDTDASVSVEIGGTSCDVAVRVGGRIPVVDGLQVGGYHLNIPAVDVHTIGAGGGTLAEVDAAAMLRVGPQGAGADPGPAAYGRGGTRPTATDAHLALGRLRPGPYAGGSINLDLELAESAVEEHIATPLGINTEQAAQGMLTLLEQQIRHAVEVLTIERGRDPRSMTLVAAGGAGGLHGTAVARALGCTKVVVPAEAGVFCAAGMLHTDLRRDVSRSINGSLDDLGADGILAALRTEQRRAELLVADEWGPTTTSTASWFVDMCYRSQLWSLRIDVTPNTDTSQIREAFEAEYERLYGHTQPGGNLEVTAVSVVMSGRSSIAELAAGRGVVSGRTPVPDSVRRCWVDAATGWAEVAVFDGSHLSPGDELTGPLIIEDRTTTVLVGAHDQVRVGPNGDFEISVAPYDTESSTEPRTGSGEDAPIRTALVQARLDHLCRHMGWVMTRTARSPIFSQSHDFSCFATTRDGTLISTADGIPIHTGGGGFAVRAILAQYGDRADDPIAEGDVFLLNDPYEAGGNHLPDWLIARPVFVDGEIVAFCCNRAHQSDIGGGAAGTYNPEASEIFHEGIRLPVIRLASRGRIGDDLWRLLVLNSRTPDLLDGDLRAMLGSTQIGADRVVELVHDLGLEASLSAFDAVCDHADSVFRSLISDLPDGTWRATEHWDDDCFGPADLDLTMQLTIDGDRVGIDFTGTDAQIAGFKNSGLVNTWSAVSMGLASFFDPDLPRNEGTFGCVEMIAPEGSIVNARPPAAMTMNTVIPAHEIVHLVWRCLAQAAPERSLAGWGKNIFGVTAGTADDKPFVMYHWSAAAGGGATPARDGFNQIGHLIALGGLSLPNLEFAEHQYPVTFHRQEFRCDGAGAGTRRGGTGIEYEVDVLVGARWSFRGEGVGSPTGFGIEGGRDGAGGEIRLYPLDNLDAEPFIAPKYGLSEFGPVRMVASSPGGGGWGDPRQRDRSMVEADLRDGVISEAAARDVYGWSDLEHSGDDVEKLPNT